jgi:hypothetical protein
LYLQQKTVGSGTGVLEDLKTFCGRINARLEDAAFEEKQAILQLLIRRISGVWWSPLWRPEEITVDGRASDLLEQWEHRFPDNCRCFPDREALVRAVLERVPPRLKLDSSPYTGFAHMRRVESDSELFVVVNSSPEHLDSRFEIEPSSTATRSWPAIRRCRREVAVPCATASRSQKISSRRGSG